MHLMRWLSILMAAVFALAAAVQWNDPDPTVWIALYCGAAAVSLAAAANYYYAPRIALLLFLIYAAGTLYTFPAVLSSDFSAYTSFKMRSTDDEVARECIGLALCAGWTFYLWRRGASRDTR